MPKFGDGYIYHGTPCIYICEDGNNIFLRSESNYFVEETKYFYGHTKEIDYVGFYKIKKSSLNFYKDEIVFARLYDGKYRIHKLSFDATGYYSPSSLKELSEEDKKEFMNKLQLPRYHYRDYIIYKFFNAFKIGHINAINYDKYVGQYCYYEENNWTPIPEEYIKCVVNDINGIVLNIFAKSIDIFDNKNIDALDSICEGPFKKDFQNVLKKLKEIRESDLANA